MAMPMCATASGLALETWTLLGFGLARRHRLPDERVFTDHNFISLALAHPGQVGVWLFDQSEEAATDADVEWWVSSKGSYLPMLVQAKKRDRRGNYSGLRQKVGRSGARQIDRLIAATSVGVGGVTAYVGHLPMYVFYNGPMPGGLPADRCCGVVANDFQRGCMLARAEEVRAVLDAPPSRRSQHVDRINGLARPWACLFCCPRGRNLVDRARGLFASDDELVRAREYAELPEYMRAIVDGEPGQEINDRPGAHAVVLTTDDGQDAFALSH
jgi:hypothetical protein